MYNFTYHRPTTARQAANLLAKHPESKLLAGGHSLIPVMKLRLASPKTIIDLSQIKELSGIELKGRTLVIGAMTKHRDVANSPIVQEAMPGLAKMADLIGDPADIGSIQPGRYADVVATDSDPLQDNTALQRIDFVMQGGQVTKRDNRPVL